MFYFSKTYDKLYSSWKDFRVSFRETFSRLYCLIYALVNLVLNVLLWWAVSFFSTRASQPLLVLHYNVDFGIDRVGEAKELFIIPSLSLLLLIINLVVLVRLEKTKYFKFISYLILNVTVFINFFLLASLLSVYLINFR